MELITLQERKNVRRYDFLEYDPKSGVLIRRQLENRNGKILVRTIVHPSGTLS